ncbi:hypothetical protein H9655_21690 [Cytobacillus sp. Sa5YUA1]|uniref:Uncharacterized protein n=1 Tax=Cytobacillus stercorigallinarum TaxID=2762240 RepID=A0ABR8QVU5_9BACI|nr:hypothetical protein [Cytobacillus stercorigallinarum]MBD7939660.1 hypothetical protein [Cytobacillus stercorigallinarum]
MKQKAKGKVYILLKKSNRQGKKVYSQSIYSFGSMPGALEKMYWLRDHPEEFPTKLKKQGFDLVDLYDWIWTIETRRKKNGKPFDVFG